MKSSRKFGYGRRESTVGASAAGVSASPLAASGGGGACLAPALDPMRGQQDRATHALAATSVFLEPESRSHVGSQPTSSTTPTGPAPDRLERPTSEEQGDGGGSDVVPISSFFRTFKQFTESKPKVAHDGKTRW